MQHSLIVLEVNIFWKKLENSLKINHVLTNIYRIQACDSIMCRYFCVGFINFMLKSKSLLEYTNLFSPNEYENYDKIIFKYFQ